MKYDKAIIIQPAGLGDIFYTLKVGEKVSELAKEVIWPVKKEFEYLKDRIITSNIKFVEWEDSLNQYKQTIDVIHTRDPNKVVIPLENADRKYPNLKIMEAKYKLANLDSSDWVNYFRFRRDFTKEQELKTKLGAEGDYVVVCELYGSPPDSSKNEIPYTGDKKVIKIDYHDGFNVFDWCGILENASELHLMDSCWIYILEKLNIAATVCDLYTRRKPNNFSQIDHIPKNIKWNYKSW